jgi:hypothetical protein
MDRTDPAMVSIQNPFVEVKTKKKKLNFLKKEDIYIYILD